MRELAAERGKERVARLGAPLAAGAALLSLLACTPLSAGAVVTFDLLHDTPESRETLKEELTKAALPEAAGTEGPDQGKSPTSGELESIWFGREKFLQIGESDKARQQLDHLWERQLERGIRNLPEYGEVLVREGRRDIQSGNLEKAREVLAMAGRLAPEFMPLYFANASLVMKKNFWDLLGAAQEISKGLTSVKRSFTLQSWVAVNLFAIVSAGLALFFAVFILALVMRNAGRMSHDISELLPMRMAPVARKILGWILFFLPVLVGLPVWWWLIAAGMLLWPYVTRVPRAVLLLAALYLLSLPWQTRILSSFLSMHRQPFLERVVSVREGHWDRSDYLALEQMSQERGASPLALASMGLAAKRLGDFEKAESIYRQALEVSPNDPALWNNLGNLSLIRRQVDEAILHYEKAVQLKPNLFSPRYNLSLAYRDKFLFPQGEQESRKAAEIDSQADAYYTSIAGEHFNRYTVDELPSLREVWKQALEENKWQKATADHLWMLSMLLFPMESWPFAVGAIVILGLGLWAYRSSLGTAEKCERCGRPYCPRCRGSRSGMLCTQCHSIFVRKEGVEARIRVKKMADIKRGQQIRAFRRVVFAVLLPGGGHLSAGRYGWGVFFFLPAALVFARLLLVKNIYPSPWHLQLVSGWGFAAGAAALFGLWWVVSFWMALKIEE
jgi:tetratricopeptide (TPR) repeat protein